MKTLIISDLHLGARNSRTDLLERLLDRDFDRLVLNGDTLDSLNFEHLRRADWRVLGQLKAIGRERELVVIRGNHEVPARPGREGDCFGWRDLLADLLGTEVREEYELETEDGRYAVLHGDQFDRTMNLTRIGHAADWCYNRIQGLSRPAARWAEGARVKRWGGVVASVKRHAVAHARQRGCAGVVTGHTHYHDDERIDGLRYLNSGCWVDWPCSYIVAEDGRARLVHWGDEPLVVSVSHPTPLPGALVREKSVAASS